MNKLFSTIFLSSLLTTSLSVFADCPSPDSIMLKVINGKAYISPPNGTTVKGQWVDFIDDISPIRLDFVDFYTDKDQPIDQPVTPNYDMNGIKCYYTAGHTQQGNSRPLNHFELSIDNSYRHSFNLDPGSSWTVTKDPNYYKYRYFCDEWNNQNSTPICKFKAIGSLNKTKR